MTGVATVTSCGHVLTGAGVTWYVGSQFGPQKAGSQHTLAVRDAKGEKWRSCLTSMCTALGFMVDVRVGLGGVVGKIGGAGVPSRSEIALGIPCSGATKGTCPWISFFK